jgi:hypothetical protein
MGGRPRWTRAGRLPAISALALTLAACEPIPQGPRPDAGFVELDENTDPRFVHYDRAGIIGVLRVAGDAVFLDGTKLARETRLRNEGHVATGPASGARIELSPGTGRACSIGVVEFRRGNLYGETRSCVHELRSVEGTARADRAFATYHASALPGRTVLMVIEGTMRVWPTNDPSKAVPVGPMQGVEVRPRSVIGPRRLTEAEVRARTAWRDRFDYSGRGRIAGICEEYAATAVRQHRENLKRDCGFSGPRWQSSRELHFAWCVTGENYLAAPRETETRQRELAACEQRTSTDAEETRDTIPTAIIETILKEFLRPKKRPRPEPDREPTTTGDAGTTTPDSTEPQGTTTTEPGRTFPGTVDLRRLERYPLPEPQPSGSDIR